MSRNILRDAVFINQVPELTEKERRYRKIRVTHRSTNFNVQKVICTDKNTGRMTTGIIFSNGKVYVGDDVWRMSNRADCCKYPFRGYGSLQIAAVDYDIREAETTFPEYAKKPDADGRRYAECV